MQSLIRGSFRRSTPSPGSKAFPAHLALSHEALTSSYRFLNNHAIGSYKIPSVLYYNKNGGFRGVKGTLDDDEIEDLLQVRWWVSLVCVVAQGADEVSGGSCSSPLESYPQLRRKI